MHHGLNLLSPVLETYSISEPGDYAKCLAETLERWGCRVCQSRHNLSLALWKNGVYPRITAIDLMADVELS